MEQVHPAQQHPTRAHALFAHANTDMYANTDAADADDDATARAASARAGRADSAVLADEVLRRLGAPGPWTRHDRFHGSLALCIIDAVQSTAREYDKAVFAVDRYRAYRRAQGVVDVVDGARDLLRTFEQAGGALVWNGKIGNFKAAYTEADALRASTIAEVAERLHALGIDSVSDLRSATTDPVRYRAAHREWHDASPIAGETDWTYFLMLAGVPWVRPHELTAAFTADALGLGADGAQALGERRLEALISAAADTVGTSPVELEHAMWRWELNRPEPARIPRDLPASLAAA